MRVGTLLFSLVLLVGTIVAQDVNNSSNFINDIKTINVSGTGTVSVQQDSVDVHLTIQKQAPTASEAQQTSGTSANNVIASLNTYNVTNLKTESISLQPIYNYTDNPSRIIAFESTYSISYTASPEIAGDTLDTAVRMGANVIESVDVSSSSQKQDDAYQDALKKAADDARKKATTVANALGICIKYVGTVNIESVEKPYPIYNHMQVTDSTMSSDSHPSPSPTIVAGKDEVKATVDVSFIHGDC